MFFSSLRVYRLGAMEQTSAQFSSLLERMQHQPPGSQDRVSRGFVPVRENGDLVYSVHGQWLVCLRSDERMLPSAVINEEATKRAKALEAQQGYRPGKKQMRELKEQIEQEMLPTALIRSRRTYAWIDPVDGWLVVDSSSPNKAEEVLDVLRKCVEEFSVRLLSTQHSPISAMSSWLAAGEAPSGFTIDRECLLVSAGEDKAKAAYSNHDLTGEEFIGQIRQHLEKGKLPRKLGMTWDERISFVLHDTLDIKKLSFLDVLKEEAEKGAENADELFDAQFTMMAGELRRMLKDVVEALGGELQETACSDDAPEATGGKDDPAYEMARKIVETNGRASPSMLQRALRIGYSRAEKLIEAIKHDGQLLVA